MGFLLSVYFWFLSLVVTAFFCTLNGILYYTNMLLGKKDPTLAVHYSSGLWAKTMVFLMPGWKIKLLNPENLPQQNQACVFVCNHESVTDILALYFLDRQFRWLAKFEVFKIPFIAQTMKWAGYIPVKRGQKSSHIKALDLSAQWLKKDVPMLFFPEGTRSENGEFLEFKIGAFKLAADCSVPVVPVCLTGTSKLMQKGSYRPGNAEVKLKVLPLEHKLDGETLEEFASRIRSKMQNEYKKMQTN